MREIILASMFSAGLSAGGTYTLMRSETPASDNGAVLMEMLQTQQAILASQNAINEAQTAIYKAQREDANRSLLLGRIIARSVTGTDPLPVLQQAKAPDIALSK